MMVLLSFLAFAAVAEFVLLLGLPWVFREDH